MEIYTLVASISFSCFADATQFKKIKSKHQIMFVRVVSTLLCVYSVASVSVPKKSYSCIEGTCQLNAKGVDGGLSHGICLTTCENGNLWPQPTGDVFIGKDFSKVDAGQIVFTSNSKNDLLTSMEESFLDSIKLLVPQKHSPLHAESKLHVKLIIGDNSVTSPSVKNNESYDIKISGLEVVIHGANIFGVRHGLETLSQLISFDVFANSLVVPTSVSVVDRPMFPYRGVMVDVARNFISVEKLKETIRAMGYNKMNVLHLHLSDSA